MVNFIYLFILLFFCLSCNNEETKHSHLDCTLTPGFLYSDYSSEEHDESESESDSESEPVPSEALSFSAQVELVNFKPEAEKKVYKAIEIIQKVVQSSEFRYRVLNFTHKNQKKFLHNNGMTNEEIYQAILKASEELLPEDDYEMDLKFKLYFSRRDIVGYTNSDELTIFMNTKFFNPYTPAEVAGNIFHEWTHKLGFGHDGIYKSERNATVPYALGLLIRELGEKYL